MISSNELKDLVYYGEGNEDVITNGVADGYLFVLHFPHNLRYVLRDVIARGNEKGNYEYRFTFHSLDDFVEGRISLLHKCDFDLRKIAQFFNSPFVDFQDFFKSRTFAAVPSYNESFHERG